MSLSFGDSLKKSANSNEFSVMAMSLEDAGVMTTALEEEGNWHKVNKSVYRFYERDYSDSSYSTVDEFKSITLDPKQINITQEQNSQYIPFKMSRYYDGFDLTKTELGIFYVNENNESHSDIPVDVYYNDDYIRFAWLVSEFATRVSGILKFEIQARGTNEKGETYVWKSKSYDKMNVIQSLAEVATGEIGLTEEELDSWYNRIQIESQSAQSAATRAETAASKAQSLVSELESGMDNKVNTAVDNKIGTVVGDEIAKQLSDYYTKAETYSKTEVDEAIAGVDVSEQLKSYVTQTALSENHYTKTETESKISDALTNYATQDYVASEIGKADISDKLKDYYKTSETYNKTEIDSKVANVKVDLSGYATTDSLKTIEETVTNVSENTVTNANNITTIQSDITTIQTALNSLKGDNENLIVQYDETGSILHLYEKDESGDVTIADGDGEIKVREISSTIITGAGGGGGGSVSTIKISVSPDGENTSTILYGNDAALSYNLSTKEATEGDDGATVYEEAIISGNITFTLYKNDVYVTQFTVKKTSSNVQNGKIDISEYIGLGAQVFSVRATYLEQLGDGETITVRSNLCKWTVNAVNLKLTNLPDSAWESTVKYGSATFSYTPVGALEKTIYFKMDDKKPETIVTSLNGTALTYTIPRQAHGVHTLQVWCEGNVGGTLISTQVHKYVLMFAEDGNETPIIRIKAPTTLEQYSSDYVYYNVFDPTSAIIDTVTLYDEEGTTLSTVENITSAEQKWEFRPTVVKDKTITVQYKEKIESVTITVTKFPYEINAVADGLTVDFTPIGRTNSDVDYNIFKNNTENPVSWTLSDNFDWVNGGWKTDENGDAYFCVKAGTSVDINYNLFGTDGVAAKKDANGEYTIAGTGKEFKLVFKTTNVAQTNATWLRCVDTADKNSLGIRMEAQNAYIDSSLGVLEIPYVDDDVIEFDMNIIPITKFLDNGEPDLTTKVIPMVITYEDGTPVQPKVITSASTNFKQDTPQPISIGSEYCDVHIYRMKVYERYLEDKEILTNFIADARSGVEMAKRYVRNDIYPVEDAQRITPESIATACPDLKVYVLSAPYFTNDKKDKVENTTIRQIHNTGTRENPEWDINENWTATGAIHNGQGTSSNEYGYSGRNLEFNMKKATITLGDNVTVVKEIQLSPTSYPTNYLNFKINIASSENANNALLQKRYDRYLPYTTLASLIDDRKKNSMEFYNCVVFIQETNEDISTHREFDNCDIQFYGIGNIGDSKKTDSSRANDANDRNEFCVEIMDWNRYLSSFPTNTMINAMGYTTDEDTNEKIYTWAKDENLGILYELVDGEYVLTADPSVNLNKTYYIDVLENDDFSEYFTYGWRYLWEDGTDEENAEVFNNCKQKWIDFYRFVSRDLTTNGVEDSSKVAAWKSEFSDWFIVDAALYYYLYTLRYTMLDNRAKNSFYHWAKHYITFEEALERGIHVYDENKNLITDDSNLPSAFYDANGNVIENINAEKAAINDGYRMEFWDYDNDTAIGIDNAGKLEIPYGVEDNDVDSGGVPYFRANDSLIFTRIAKYFTTELEDAWHNTEINPIGKAFDSTNFINEFDAWQEEFPEELWRLDYERKYKRTYVGGTGEEWNGALPQSNKSDVTSTRFLTEMMNGRKKYQRRCFERNQEIYMSSKFKGEVNIGDTITLRGTGLPTNKVVEPNFALTITPFSKMYVNLYNSTGEIYYHQKCEAGITITPPIEYPNTNLDFIYIRGASQMQSLGDLSPMYLQTAELTAGAKLKTIILGNATDGYSNDSLKTLQIGAGNKLLEELDIRNLSGLSNTVLPITNIPSLKRVYAQGSNITEARFANNGLLEEAYLPSTITRLELRNLNYLNTVELESYENLLYLTVMDCSDAMNNIVLNMINQASDLKELRVTNINWTFDNTALLGRLYSLITNVDSPEVVLTGKVYVPTIKQKLLTDCQKVWPNLEIAYSTLIEQYAVTFVNDDGAILEVQYVDKGGNAIDPTTRAESPITPTKESSVEYDYTFAGWEGNLTSVFADRIITATYSESLRSYAIKYVSKGVVMQSSTGLYGENVPYTGSIPTYTAEESGYVFYLFNRWDKSGFIDGDKTVNAIFDKFEYNENSFNGKKLSGLSPVEIYAMNKLNLEKSVVTDKDQYTITVGNDVDYDDITSKLLISEKTHFDGSNCVDTELKLFEEDKDFVLAIDYEFLSGNKANAVLAQCFQANGSIGFKLWYSNNSSFMGAKFSWGTASDNVVSIGKREVIVIRHKKGDKNLTIYKSNLDGDEVLEVGLTAKSTIGTNTLVFGCAKGDDGIYENHAIGNINWAKVWFADLGEDTCKSLAMWTHETIGLEACGFKKYYLSNDSSKRCSFSLLASHLLDRTKVWNTSSTNDGGWANSKLNKSLNTRLYEAMPVQLKQLLKQVIVYSNDGITTQDNNSHYTEVTSSNCYITIPSIVEVDSTKDSEPYNSEGTFISYLNTNESRKRAFAGGDYNDYWTRSPSTGWANYVWRVNDKGEVQGVTNPANSLGVLIEISF